MALLTEK